MRRWYVVEMGRKNYYLFLEKKEGGWFRSGAHLEIIYETPYRVENISSLHDRLNLSGWKEFRPKLPDINDMI